MSLVAYDDSSDSDFEQDEESTVQATIVEKKATVVEEKASPTNGHISDEEDDFMQHSSSEQSKLSTFSLSLPKPRREATIQELIEDFPKTSFSALPTPKSNLSQTIIEEDDEFLHKKDNFVCAETKPASSVLVTKARVKITVPSLKDFHDVKEDMKSKPKTVSDNKDMSKTGLLSILPQAKSERSFNKTDVSTKETVQKSAAIPAKSSAPAFIPDSVKYKRPAHSTEVIDDIKPSVKRNPTKPQNKSNVVSANINEGSDDEDNMDTGGDFFSLTAADDTLPDVSVNEINMLVAKKAARMAEATTKYLKEAESQATQEIETQQSNQQELEAARKRYHDSQLDSEAVQALVGSSAKRRKNQNDAINIVDLNSEQILPNRDEWMRTALASSTTYQPTGVLVDEEPAAGTRRKHQITYLAHKAKANEAELQAMWAANRQNRRATQSKYGF